MSEGTSNDTCPGGLHSDKCKKKKPFSAKGAKKKLEGRGKKLKSDMDKALGR